MSTKFIGICNQKGGCGKSTVAIILASYLQYEKGKNIAFIDADNPQLSVHKQRVSEVEMIDDENIKELFLKQNKPTIYPIYPVSIESAVSLMLELDKMNAFDYVIVDLPGSASNEAMMNVVAQLDKVFIPVEVDQKAVRSSYEFGATLSDQIIPDQAFPLKQAFFFWTKFSHTEKKDLFEFFRDNIFTAINIPFMENVLLSRVGIKTQDICNTYFAPNRTKVNKDKMFLYEFLDEIINKTDQ